MSAAFRTLLFDLDGTLVDSRELILDSFRYTMRTHLGLVPPDSTWLTTMGTPLRAQLRDFARSEEEHRAMVATYMAHNHAAHDAMIRSFPGVCETLERLASEGYRLGIVSSKLSEAVALGLRACGIRAELFGSVIGADTVSRHKPDPVPVLAALAELGEAEPRRALFVGDTVFDLRAGRAAGTFTAAALWGPCDRAALEPAEPDFWLPRIEAVFDVLSARDGRDPAPVARPDQEPV